MLTKTQSEYFLGARWWRDQGSNLVVVIAARAHVRRRPPRRLEDSQPVRRVMEREESPLLAAAEGWRSRRHVQRTRTHTHTHTHAAGDPRRARDETPEFRQQQQQRTGRNESTGHDA
ncbi:hypothetical protein F2P81_011265 [Scophthalmus maximus]|uniref:Uncharacterized protein n=1 Tax=Scophthalmus maximus TaxID=52904 RepID=A0A6A4SPP7_SCOMX|nr:hypothetical protein F2P81_011265 [Scophthalmus maximus]